MKKVVKIFAILSLLAVLAFQYVNCSDEQPDNMLFNQLNQTSCLDDSQDFESCTQSSIDNLAVYTTMSTVSIDYGQTVFNVGGDCNEGGFADNRIDWQIIDADTGATISSSVGNANPICTYPEAVGSLSVDYSGKCQNGRFNMLVPLPDGYKGLNSCLEGQTAGVLKNLDVKICISGVEGTRFVMGGSSKHIDLVESTASKPTNLCTN